MAAVQRLGKLRHQVSLQSRTQDLDTLGRQKRTAGQWVTIATPWAEVTELSGRQGEIARQQVPEASHLVRIRYRDGITTANRFVFRSRTLEVKAVIDQDGTRRELNCFCGEIRN